MKQDISEEELSKIEEQEASAFEYAVMPPDNIFAYTEQRSCADLVRMIEEEDLCRDPFYQRADVWKNPQQTRFIDSLLKRLPIPSMCISVDYNEKYNVIDGKQRITAIIAFLQNDDWILSNLSDIDERISGKSVKQIRDQYPQIYSAIKNLTIPVNMIRCDYKRLDNMEYIFTIFHRLNTGGISLNNQEIRNCIFSGSLTNMLNSCNEYEKWKSWVPSVAASDRMRGQERILTFFAFHQNINMYDGKLNNFLNDFTEKNRNANEAWVKKQTELFKSVIDIASKIDIKLKSNIFIDAVMHGVAANLEICKKKDTKELQKNYEQLIITPYFSAEKIREGTARKTNLISRLKEAKQIFGNKD